MVRPDLDWSDCKLWILGLKPRAKCSEKFSRVNRKLTCNTVCTVASSWCFSLIPQLFPRNFSLISWLFPFPNYFSLISHLFLSYFPVISHLSIISHLFLQYFPNVSHFSTISQLLFACFSTISRLLPDFPGDFPTISRLLPNYLNEPNQLQSHLSTSC